MMVVVVARLGRVGAGGGFRRHNRHLRAVTEARSALQHHLLPLGQAAVDHRRRVALLPDRDVGLLDRLVVVVEHIDEAAGGTGLDRGGRNRQHALQHLDGEMGGHEAARPEMQVGIREIGLEAKRSR